MRYFISTQSPATHKVVHVFLTIYICVFLPENLTGEFSGYENSLPGCVLEITPGSETACVSQKCCQRFKATACAANYQIIKREGGDRARSCATSTSQCYQCIPTQPGDVPVLYVSLRNHHFYLYFKLQAS